MSSSALDLARLAEGMPGLTSAKGRSFAEAAAVCLESQSHESGVECVLLGTFPEALITAMQWDEVDNQQRQTHADLHEATEDGAAGIAILALHALTGLSVRERAVIGTGVDYWLGHDSLDDEALPFQDLTRLEVSGILSGDDVALGRRIQHKLRQTFPTDHVCQAYVVVVEFGRPVIHVEAK